MSRLFLAKVCDNDQLMGAVTPSGISLIENAKYDLNMPSPLVFKVDGKQAWINKTNLPSPVKVNKKLKELESQDQIDWLWIEMGSIPGAEVLMYRELMSSAIGNGCKPTILCWCLGGEEMDKKVKE